MNLNRAVNEDIVCVEVLPQQDWSCPSSIVIDEEIKEDEVEESTSKQVKSHREYLRLDLFINEKFKKTTTGSHRLRRIT